MKLFKVAIPFNQHWLQFCRQYPALSAQPWADQQATISENWFGFPHVWKHALEPLGYEVIEVLANAEIVQKKWAAENAVDYRESLWSYDIAKAQILKAKPDILFVADLFWFSDDWITEVRQACPSIRLVVGWYGAPIRDKSILHACDLVLSCIPEFVEQCRSEGLNSRHLNHSFDERLLNQVSCVREPDIDLSFVGNVRRKRNFDSGREKLLVALAKETSMQIFSDAISSKESLAQRLKLFAKVNLHAFVKAAQERGCSEAVLASVPLVRKAVRWEKPPMRAVNPKLVPCLKPPVYGLDMFQVLRQSKITFNKHIDASPRSASNMRMYEATGIGTCLVTDHKSNIRDLFEPDKEVVTYQGVEDCVEKIDWLLRHPKERDAIAKAGQQRTMRDHTLEQRAAQFDQILRQALGLSVSAF